MKRSVFLISDRTGITVGALGKSLLTQFPDLEFRRISIPFVTNQSAAERAAQTIRNATKQEKLAPLVFSTLTDPETQRIISASSDNVFDLFETFIEPLEDVLGCRSSHTAGRMHGIGNSREYERRVNALNYSLGHDDGISSRDLKEADIVLIGVSRCGKTPTCLYLAMHFALRAANYPLTDNDFVNPNLPEILQPCRAKLYGLTIAPAQLTRIRKQRRLDGIYSAIAQCRREVSQAEALFNKEHIDFLDTTTISIEEIAATIVRDKGLR